jgi:polar amino acid transport system substrate-binding protein
MSCGRAAVLALCLLALAPGKGLRAEEVVLGSSVWTPFSGNSLADGGTLTRLLKEAFAEVGMTLRREEMPWARVFEMIDQKQIDGGYPLGKTPEREARYIYSDEIAVATRYIWHLNTRSFDWKTVNDFKGLRIGILRGAVFGSVHEELLKRIAADPGFADIQEVASDEQNFQKLLEGRIDIALCELNQASDILSRLGALGKVGHHPRAIMDNSALYVIFLRDARGEYLVEKVNKGLRMLKQGRKP